jgi:hypothetical protein
MFGRDSLPSRIYSYGAYYDQCADEPDPVVAALKLAHAYREDRLEEELKRRQRVAEAMDRHFPHVKVLKEREKELDKEVEALRTEMKRANQRQRTKIQNQEMAQAIHDKRAELKSVRIELKAAKKAAWNDADLKAEQDEIDKDVACKLKELRKNSGLYWPTYLAVEQSQVAIRKGAPPRHRGFRGDGKLAVQIQKGMPVYKLYTGTDTRLRIQPPAPAALEELAELKRARPPATASPEVRRAHEKQIAAGFRSRLTTAYFRIGSDERKKPIFAQVRFRMHRPLPDGCMIKWANLIRRRRATHYKWKIQFVVSKASGFAHKDLAKTGACGIDMGWRIVPKGLRVAALVAVDDINRQHFRKLVDMGLFHFRNKREGELILPARDLERWARASEIQSARDLNFDAARARLAVHLAAMTNRPDWLGICCEEIAKWRAPKRLAVVALTWRHNRFSGDEEAFTELESWRALDKRNYEEQVCTLTKALNFREWIYRNFARACSRSFAAVAVEDTNWAKLQRKAPVEKAEANTGQRDYQRIASCGRIRQCLREVCARTAEQEAAFTTQRCCYCLEREVFDAATDLEHVCSHCGKSWDQDYSAALLLLGLLLGTVPPLVDDRGAA